MPNWCSNKLQVSGPAVDISEFTSKNIKNGSFGFDAFVPMPEALKTGEGWYEWSVQNWGTKWDLRADDEISFEEDRDSTDSSTKAVVCFFSTAWAPPIAWQEKVSTAFPTLTISLWYDESGGDFAGLSEMIAGESTIDCWEDASCSFANCSGVNCDEIAYGPSAWERDGSTEIGKLFCESEHALEGEVQRVIS